jgi:hypothetical protein
MIQILNIILMKISHEVPKALFIESTFFNQYPYVLGHLIKLDSEYKEFYKRELKNADYSILDNSAFELGKSIPFDELMSVARELRPTHLILPDTVHDKETTIKNSIDFYNEFCSELDILQITPIGVVQGNSFEDLYECICKYMEAGIYFYAIPFDCIKDTDYGTIRFQFFRWLIDKMGVSQMSQLDFHFLGLQNPQEILLYSKLEKELIHSIDSSSPILHGVAGNEFTEWGCLFDKPKMKLADNLGIEMYGYMKKIIDSNVKLFRQYCNG